MKKIMILDYNNIVTTGGHKYNSLIYSSLSNNLNAEISTAPHLSSLYSNRLKLLAPFLELKNISNLKKFDLVYFKDTSVYYHFLLIIFTRLFTKAHCVIIIHHFPFLNSSGFRRVFDFLIQFVYYSFATSLIVPSPYTLSVAKKLFRKSKILYIPLPFEKKFSFSNYFVTKQLLYVGTIEKRKGLVYLIKALNVLNNENHNDYHLYIVGKAVNKQYLSFLEKMIDDYQLSKFVHFMGRVSDIELENLYNESEIFTFASLLEGYGIVLIEAMRHGLPIVAFNNSAMPYTIKNGINGYLAKNKDFRDFADKITLISGNNTLRMSFQKGMEETISRLHTIEDFSRCWVSNYLP